MDHEVEHHVHESPVSMTGVLAVLAVLSAVGGFLSMPHFLEPLLPLPAVPESLHHFEMPLLVVSVAIALAGLARRRVLLRRRRGARRPRACARGAGCTRCCPASTSSTSSTSALLGRPLVWISDRVFLRLGDRLLLDGTLDGTAHLAQRGAGVLSRIQSGNLHRYLLFVLAGSAACLLWSVTRG